MEFPLSMYEANTEQETLEIAGKRVASIGAKLSYLVNKVVFAVSNCEKDLIRLFLTVRYELDPSLLADNVIAGRFFALLAKGEFEVRYRIANIDEKETEEQELEFKMPETLKKLCQQIKNLEQIVGAVRWKLAVGGSIIEEFILSENELDKIGKSFKRIDTIKTLDFIPIRECMDQKVADLWADFNLDKMKRHGNFIRNRFDELIDKHKASVESHQCVTDCGAMELLMAEFEEKFQKQEPISLKDHEERLSSFMEIRKKEAEKGTRKGQRSLMELLQQLGEERASTFEEVKALAIDIGTNISRFFDHYFWILAYSSEMERAKRSLKQVESTLKCLTEEGKSIFTDKLLAVLKFTSRKMNMATVCKIYEKKEKADRRGRRESDEKEIPWLLLREILRLEVAFRCPGFPMMLTDEVLLSMGNHLRNVIGKKLNQVGLEMVELLDQYKPSIDYKHVGTRHRITEHVDSKMNEIWSQLTLRP